MILVFGAGGLLGTHLCALYPDDTLPITKEGCDITDPVRVDFLLQYHKPEIVINCAGIVPRSPDYSDAEQVIRVNSYAPKVLGEACSDHDIKLIHVSTDCVFSGLTGNYDEKDIPNPNSLYGLSKYIGEVTRYPHLTVRTSFIGYPDPTQRGLLQWFKDTDPITGYAKYWWNGITTTELARVLMEDIQSYTGLLHIGNRELTSKYNLLETANKVYGWNKEIDAVDDPEIDRTLDHIGGNWINKPYEQMLEEMKSKEETVWTYLKKF